MTGDESAGAPGTPAGGAAGELRDFLLGTTPDETRAAPYGAAHTWAAHVWAAEEIRRVIPDFLSPAEYAALEGRFATARSAFGAGLALFRPALDEGPELFRRYPALLTDLGRCFQFTASGNEGIELFLAWERQAPSAPLHYQLLYFAGRIARAREDYDRSRELFTQALAFAPDDRQADACVWYIMDTALRDTAADPIGLISTWMPRWHDPAYFNDILDRIASGLALSGQWRRFPEALALLEGGADRSSRAKYAYISGRALSVGLIPVEDAAVSGGDRRREGPARREESAPAGDPPSSPAPALPPSEEESARKEAAARRYLRAAYDAGTGALYYRLLSAYALGEPFWEDGGRTDAAAGTAPVSNFLHPREMDFLLGFFKARIPGPVPQWLEFLGKELSVGELRVLAEAMEAAGDHTGQIRLVTAYMGRNDYEPARRDLELVSPRPFRELVEAESLRTGFPPELLYGLIHTESAFQAEIVSWAGAVGLTQLMPATAMDMAARMRRQGGADYTADMAANLRDPAINLRIGSFYLAYLRDLLDHPLLSILAYNGGMNRIRRWRQAQRALPGDLFLETVGFSETREYGRRVVSAAVLYGYLYYDMKTDPFLADICR
jgi:soluble lytic murein transglycosylase